MTEQLFLLLRSFITLFSSSFIFHLMKIFFLIQIQFIYIYKISLYIDFAVVQNGIFTEQKFNQYGLRNLDW